MNEVDELRKKIKEGLQEFIGPGKLSPETVAPFLKMSYRTLYRYLSDAFFLPSIDLCKLIMEVEKKILDIQGYWLDVINSWNSDKDEFIKKVEELYIDHKFLVVLENQRDAEWKAWRLVTLSLQKWQEK